MRSSASQANRRRLRPDLGNRQRSQHECGWGGQIPSDNATRAALIQRFYGYRVPSVPQYIDGGFYWHFRQTMVPSGTPDWTVLQSLMSTA